MSDEKDCKQAFDDFYHKIKAEVSYGHWCVIWRFISKRQARGEPVKVPSDAEILALAASEHLGHFDKHGKLETCWSQSCDIDDEVLAFARALLSKYAAPKT